MERKPQLSRRDFLKLAGAGALGAALAGIDLVNGKALEKSPLTPEKIDFLATHPVTYGRKDIQTVIMTYDEGQKRKNVEHLLDVYKELGARGTFFITGAGIRESGDLLKRMVDEGHTLGCHSFTHPEMTALKDSGVKGEFDKWFTDLRKYLPDYEVKYWRAPYGSKNNRVLRIAAEYGMQHVGWTGESGGQTDKSIDYVFRSQNIYENYYKGVGGMIMLSHTHRYYDAWQAEAIVKKFQEQGFNLVNIDEGIDPADRYVEPVIGNTKPDQNFSRIR